MGGLTKRGDASAMTTSECRRVSIEAGLGEGARGRSADTARSLGFSGPADTLEKDGDTDLAWCARCVCVTVTLFSSLGALGAVPNARSRSSLGNSRLVGTIGRLGMRPGRTHCMLLGPPPIGALGAGKPGLSDGGYIEGGRVAIGVLSAFGPVGILAGKLLGDVLIKEALPLPLRDPSAVGSPLGDVSLGAYCGSWALEKDGDALARSAACGATGGARGLGAGP